MQTRVSMAFIGVAYTMRIASGFIITTAGLSVTGRQAYASAMGIDRGGECAAGAMMSASGGSMTKVLVTGAGGRTGGIVFEKLLERDGFVTKGMVRSEKSSNKLLKKEKAADENIVIADVTEPSGLAKAMEGIDKVILCTSAVPKIYPFSIVRLLVKKLLQFKDPGRPKFYFGERGTPEEVDWLGAKAQIDAAKAAGVKHFVYLGSMGGTQPDNFLNTIGKNEDGTGGDILVWKRKAEEYLIASGMDYTIIHPGGLLDEPGGKRQLVLGVDDTLLQREKRSIPRADVAQLCIECLVLESAKNRSFDVITNSEGEGEVTSDFGALLETVKANTDYNMRPQPSTMN